MEQGQDLDKLLWGELYPLTRTDALPIKLWWEVYEDPQNLSKVTSLAVVVSPHSRVWRGRRVDIPGKKVGHSHSIDIFDLRSVQTDPWAGVFQQASIDIARRLYEVDPRIGAQLQATGLEPSFLYQRCLLFDPPGGVQRPMVAVSDPGGLRPDFFNRWTKCGLCKAPFTEKETTTWGGGNLLWVCERCMADDGSSPIS